MNRPADRGILRQLAQSPDGMYYGPLPSGHRRRGAGLVTEQIPDLERAIVLSRHKGRTIYCDSAVAVSGNGDSWTSAYSTLVATVAAAFNDDVILVAPGHAESVLGTALNLSKLRITIIGLGNGNSRPTFTFNTANTATITVSAAGITISNCVFVANFLNVASAFTLAAAKDFRIDSCDFVDTSAALNFLSCVVTGAAANAADGLVVTNSSWWSLATTANAFVSVLGNLDRLYVADNYVDKLATNDAGQFITIAALVIRRAQILRNYLNVVGSAGAAVGVFMTGSSTTNTGIVAHNFCVSLDTTGGLLLTATLNLGLFNNGMSGAIASSATMPWPTADSPA